jgi:phage/plasmid primase-like uncharacterized protein
MNTAYSQEIKTAMEQKGILVDDIIFDGNIHRCDTVDKPGNKNGWYVAHSDKPVSVAYGNWRTDEKYTYCSKMSEDMSPEERAFIKKRTKKMRNVSKWKKKNDMRRLKKKL